MPRAMLDQGVVGSPIGEILEIKPSRSGKLAPETTRLLVFLAYCRENSAQVLALRNALVSAGETVWWDQDILGGQDWRREVRTAMQRAYAVIACFSKETDARHESEMFPEIRDSIEIYRRLRPGIDFLIPVRLSDAQVPHFELDSTRSLPSIQHIDLFPASHWQSGIQQLLASLKSIYRESGRFVAAKPAAATTTIECRISPTRLPQTGEYLVGRASESARLTRAWRNPRTNIVQVAAAGGIGKTQLVKKWCQRIIDKERSGQWRLFDWSFYSQGSTQQATSDDFFAAAMSWFGSDVPIRDPWERGTVLASLIREHRTLLVLDGLEPLQHPPGPMEGRLADPSLQALLRSLAYDNSGLCIVTTRQRVPDLNEVSEPHCATVELSALGRRDGAALLRKYGVRGNESELEAAVSDYGGHALALILLGTYLRDRFQGDIRMRSRVDYASIADAPANRSIVTHWISKADPGLVRHARKVMASYVNWFSSHSASDARGEDHEVMAASITILRLMGLFNRPADAACLQPLRSELIEGLTEPLFAWGDGEDLWERALIRLRKARLIADPVRRTNFQGTEHESIDAHPIVREYFANELETQFCGPRLEAHRRLYEHYKHSVKDRPDSLAEMMPLYFAVQHASAAGLAAEAYRDVYRPRIRRIGGKREENYAVNRLGAFSIDLLSLSYFFDDAWERPSDRLLPHEQAELLNSAGFRLGGLGRLRESLRPTKLSLDNGLASHDWLQAAIRAVNLSEQQFLLGELSDSLRSAEQSIELADLSGDPYWRVVTRAVLGDVYHQLGYYRYARQAFADAENLQGTERDEPPYLYSFHGFKYCDLLTDFVIREVACQSDASSSIDSPDRPILTPQQAIERCQALDKRVSATLTHNQSRSLLTHALHYLVEARIRLLQFSAMQALHESENSAIRERWKGLLDAERTINKSVAIHRESQLNQFLPRPLIQRAQILRWKCAELQTRDESEQARVAAHEAFDAIREAKAVAERGEMLIWRIEACVEAAQLGFLLNVPAKACEQLREARRLIAGTVQRHNPYRAQTIGWKPPEYVGVVEFDELIAYRRHDIELKQFEHIHRASELDCSQPIT